jgi:hypothetical protein
MNSSGIYIIFFEHLKEKAKSSYKDNTDIKCINGNTLLMRQNSSYCD